MSYYVLILFCFTLRAHQFKENSKEESMINKNDYVICDMHESLLVFTHKLPLIIYIVF